MATRFIDHLLEGDHASRPAFGDVPQGTLYSCSDHSLIYQSDGSTAWSTWATLGTSIDWGETGDIVDQDYDDTADGGALNEVARADHRHGMPSEGGGPGGSAFYLDSITLDGTLGDDFDAATLDAKWTAVGPDSISFEGGTALIDLSYSTGARSYYQSLTSDDEIIVDLSYSFQGSLLTQIGAYLVDNSGDGVGGCWAFAEATLAVNTLTTYVHAAYQKQSAAPSTRLFDQGGKVWLRLEKRGNLYVARSSFNGNAHTIHTAAYTSSLTPTRVGWGRTYLAAGAAQHLFRVDRFNARILSYGNNLVITPTSGTPTYSADSVFSSPTYDAANAANGNRASGEWARSGTTLPIWWQVDWSVGQTLNRVFLFGRSDGEHLGNVQLVFSDGSKVAVQGPIYAAGTIVEFPTKTGITSMRVNSLAGAAGNPGLFEVEAYLAS